MNNTPLENSIRDEADRAIREIEENAVRAIKEIDDTYGAEIEDFKTRIQTQTDARIRQESSKVENRETLNLKKLKLRNIEVFINKAVEAAVQGIRDNPRYKNFLLKVIFDVVDSIPVSPEIRLKREDLIFEKELREALSVVNRNKSLVFKEDKTITWGGCIIEDVLGKRIFDCTIERIYFRKSLMIRREVIKLLTKSS